VKPNKYDIWMTIIAFLFFMAILLLVHRINRLEEKVDARAKPFKTYIK